MVRMNDRMEEIEKENNKCNKLLKSIIAFATSFLTVAVGGIVKAVKDYLLRKGGEKAVIIAEILAKNAVHAVEQVASETGYKGEEKLEQARAKVRAELTKYNISMTDKDLDTFVESAVKQMNDAWKGR
ncbi:phage holin, LL-H family [Streptococcus pneumoniae GA04175]|nr:phage holin, LL-H family [Streptococcus pneumoniae GA04175]